ncbi:MAG: thiamine pyrophosphate-dependent enzyme, partial [Gammaproteobacteria bacterium]|nr:thiamine pyrophosphate-dependent enzyme [Gammaproteobacteria bacterium]
HQHWVARHFNFSYPDRLFLTSGGHGAMGYDLPSAIGAKIARRNAMVLCIVGDGSFQMNIQELAMLKEYDLPIKIVVLDNNRLGLVSHFQKLNWDSDPTCGDKWNPEFSRLAEVYGLRGFKIESRGDLDSVLDEFLQSREAALVHCIIDSKEDISPMLLAGQSINDMWHQSID